MWFLIVFNFFFFCYCYYQATTFNSFGRPTTPNVPMTYQGSQVRPECFNVLDETDYNFKFRMTCFSMDVFVKKKYLKKIVIFWFHEIYFDLLFFPASFINTKSRIQSWRGRKSKENNGWQSSNAEVVEAGSEVSRAFVRIARGAQEVKISKIFMGCPFYFTADQKS